MMGKFLGRILLFLLLAGVPLLLTTFLLPRFDIAPVLTESISYDLKLDFIASQNAHHYDLLSVGSSINLNNLHSETLLQAFPEGTSYLNLASFNANISNSFEILQALVARYQPKTVVMMSNHLDFESKKWQGLSLWQINKYLDHSLAPYFYLRKFNFYSLLQRRRRTRRFMSDARANMQQQLRYDAYGGVPLQVSKTNLNPKRQDFIPITEIDSSQYHVLEKMADWLQQMEVKLIYVQSPLKISNCQTPDCQDFQLRHIERCKTIIERNGHQFIDLYSGLTLPDSVFCDEAHLHFQGPQMATSTLIKRLLVQN